MSHAHPFDHAVISVRDRMDEAAAIYARLGFTLTERGFHSAGSSNHLMVFATDYLELIGFPPAGTNVRPDLAQAPIGLDGLVLKASDPRALYERLHAADWPAGEPQLLTRPVRAGPASEEARFTTVRFPREALAGGRLYFCRHETPHLVWNRAWQSHPNGALSIARFTIAVSDPQAEADKYERILGTQAQRAGAERMDVNLGTATLELVTPAALRDRLGPLACDPRDADGRMRESYMAMVALRVADLARTASTLRAGGFAAERRDRTALVVPASEAMNCTILFEAAS